MCANALEKLRIDRRPETLVALALPHRAQRSPSLLRVATPSQLRPSHVGHRHRDLEIDRRGATDIDDLDLAVATQKARDLLRRPRRRRQSDALGIARRSQAGDAFQREPEMNAALVRRQGVDLVDDDRVDASQALALLRTQDQIQRLRGRNQNLGRAACLLSAFLGGAVARPDRDPRRSEALRPTSGLGGPGDFREREPQIALDVVDQRLQWRDVENPHAGLAVFGKPTETIDGFEECGQRLAAARRRDQQCVLACDQQRPACSLHRRRRIEMALEPGTGRRIETRRQTIHRNLSPRSGPKTRARARAT